MSHRRTPFAPGEWYHCYTRGVEKRKTFKTGQDYDRFIEALYLCNNTKNINRGDFKNVTHENVLSLSRQDQLVAIGAYCLMPNHFHLLLKELIEGGISRFMQRVGTSYAMYFNSKYSHVGGLFIGPFRAKHIADDRYLRKIVPYIHLNPIALSGPAWKAGKIKVRDWLSVEKQLREYQHSSLPAYLGDERLENVILDQKEIESLLGAAMPELRILIPEALEYYEDLFPKASPLEKFAVSAV